ncbi:cuticle protein 8-like [Palaemon carinicauda]|uniref:cuticle protein 8-like n=1 Tax=Palaemon carinicauda TaxID=392227 RepID=UPI0035B5CA5E
MYQVTFLLVVGVASMAAGDVSHLHSPVHHGHASPVIHSPVHHASPVLHSPVHHASPVLHSPVHHASPHAHSPVHHASPVVHSPVHHASPAIHSPVHHASPKHHAPVHHGSVAKHAKPVHHGNTGYGHETYHDVPAAYNYNYLVHDDYSGAHFGQDEIRDGYKTEGKYFVHLPDGRIQTVTYYADETGYHATVSYEGEAHYDAHTPHHAPAYHAPEPAYHAPIDTYH